MAQVRRLGAQRMRQYALHPHHAAWERSHDQLRAPRLWNIRQRRMVIRKQQEVVLAIQIEHMRQELAGIIANPGT